MNNWSVDIEFILEQIRLNCVYMSNAHKTTYFYYKQMSTFFRIPTIVISSVASVSSVGLQAYISQSHINGIICILTLVIGVINSIELFLKIQETLELELEQSKLYYQLATDIFKLLKLDHENRLGNSKEILDLYYDKYTNLFQNSNLTKIKYTDKLLPIIKKSIFSSSSQSVSSSLSNTSPLNDPDL